MRIQRPDDPYSIRNWILNENNVSSVQLTLKTVEGNISKPTSRINVSQISFRKFLPRSFDSVPRSLTLHKWHQFPEKQELIDLPQVTRDRQTKEKNFIRAEKQIIFCKVNTQKDVFNRFFLPKHGILEYRKVFFEIVTGRWWTKLYPILCVYEQRRKTSWKGWNGQLR